jgi:23S rRNA pseudouridine1911/1915/1917 synthase
MNRKIALTLNVKTEQIGQRVDVVIAEAFKEFSRSHLQKLIKEGAVKVNGKEIKPKLILQGGELIEILAKEAPKLKDKAENIDLEIIYEDQDLLVVNKASGLVVHPGAGNPSGTLVNGLLNFDSNLSYLPRAGIVHRLDKDTSGLMVVSRNEKTYLNLIDQLKERTVTRKYTALVVGEPSLSGVIDKPIGRHPKVRTKQAVVSSGKEAISRFKRVKSLKGYSLVEVLLETGRTHQIRVHLSYLGFPIVGDNAYGGRRKYVKGTSENLRNKINQFKRQALHASSLTFIHPSTKEVSTFDSELPDDMKQLIRALKEDD